MTTAFRVPLKFIGAAIGAAAFMAVSPAIAEIVQIPGPAFVRQCPCNISTDPATESNGSISVSNGASSYFATLPYSGAAKVCAMSMIYRDVNQAEQLTVTLLRKKIDIGGSIDAAPGVVARVRSAGGAPNTVRKADAPTINSPTVNSATGFYYLRADFENVNMDLVGVQVDIRPNCPG